MGLLDMFQSPDARGALAMLAAAGPSAQPLSFGQRMTGLLQQMDQQRAAEEDRKARQQMQALQAGLLSAQLKEHESALAQSTQAIEAEQKFRSLLPSPQGQAVQSALAGGGGPTVANAQRMPEVDPMAQMQYEAMRLGQIKPMDYLASLRKDTTPIKLGAGETLLQPGTYKPLAHNPKEATPSDIGKLMAEMNALPPGSPMRAIYQQAIQKATTHQPGVSVSYGAPVAGVDMNGNPIYFQPSKDGGAPSIIKGVAPPAKEMPASMAEKFAQNAVTLGKIDKAISLVKENPNALGAQNYLPDSVVQRMDPQGVEVRAMVADIGGQRIHDRAGASQTVGEVQRLKPYIPNLTDSPATIKEKLTLFRNEYAAMQSALASGASIKDAARSGGTAAPAASASGFRVLGKEQ